MEQAFPIDWSRYALSPDVVTREVASLRPYAFTWMTIPGMGDDAFAYLLESVRAHGVLDPLTVTDAGEVVDGRARLRAAQLADLSCVPTRVLEAEGEVDYLVWTALAHLGRRHLTRHERFALLSRGLILLDPQTRTPRNGCPVPPNPAGPVRPHTEEDHAADEEEPPVAVGQSSSDGHAEACASWDRWAQPAREALTSHPVWTMRLVAALVIEWVEQFPTLPPADQDQFWLALENVMDSGALVFRRRGALAHPAFHRPARRLQP